MNALCRATCLAGWLLCLAFCGFSRLAEAQVTAPPLHQQIDEFVAKRLTELKLVPATVSSDAEFDRTLVTLLDDLSERGMLEHTLVIIVGEMGRTPQINNLGGRDHWGRAWSMAMAGCGVKPGVVYGSTNETGTEVKDNQVKLGDLFHTYLRALGIDSRMKYQIGGQTNPVADPAAKPIDALLS